MSVCCSVGYYGSCANSPRDIKKPYDLSCPNISKNGELNFWKNQCAERIGNKEVKCCYRGCTEAAKHPELKAKMDIVLAKCSKQKKQLEDRDKQTDATIRRTKYARQMENLKRKERFPKESRAKIIDMYTSGMSVHETTVELNCGRTVVSLYRKMFREGAMNTDGSISI